MINLSFEQEEIILLTIKDMCSIDNGAARAVYECPETIVKMLNLDNTNAYVIKLALGKGGYTQNRNEIDFFLKHGKNYPLAEIYAAGRYIEIMEAVDCEDWRDFADEVYDLDEYFLEREDDGCEDDDEFKDACREAFEVIGQLEEINGTTADNGQLGRNSFGNLVAYDYGFVADLGCRNQTSDISDLISSEYMEEYIVGLTKILCEDEMVLEEFERRILSDASNRYDEENADSDEENDDSDEENDDSDEI